MNRRTLGRGLSALLGGFESEEGMSSSPVERAPQGNAAEIALHLIDANPYQPRTDFDPAEIESLADSFRLHGLLQPVVVRAAGDRFQLVAGERRLRAAQSLGWSAIPARVVELDDRQTCELALVENLQRKDLNAIEKARAFERYLAQFHATHEELARQLGIDRSTVTNMVRLLELPDAVQEMVVAGRLSSGHGRALLTVEDPIAQWTLATQSADEGLSVRQTEALVREHRSRSASGVPTEVGPVEQAAVETGPEAHADTELASAVPEEERSHHLDSIENELRQRLGIRVQIHAKGHEGSITLHFGSGDDFERILDQLRR